MQACAEQSADAAILPFRYTVNGYRGCSHACRCFARPTHVHLDLDCGTDFDTQVVVKTNVAEVSRRELTARRGSARQSPSAPIRTRISARKVATR